MNFDIKWVEQHFGRIFYQTHLVTLFPTIADQQILSIAWTIIVFNF
jgi:hypothetical protein